MATPQPRVRPEPAAATTLLELDFGDQELIVAEYADGVVVVRIDDGTRLVLDLEQLREVVRGFRDIGKKKGWR